MPLSACTSGCGKVPSVPPSDKRSSGTATRTIVAAAVTASALFALTACTNRNAPVKGASAVQVSSQLPKPYSFPLDVYAETGPDRGLLLDATDKLTNSCAADHGVLVHLPTDVTFGSSSWAFEYSHDIRPTGSSVARRYGYHIPPPQVPKNLKTAYNGIPVRELDVIEGVPSTSSKYKTASRFLADGGCAGYASKVIYGTSPHDYAQRKFRYVHDINYVADLVERSLTESSKTQTFNVAEAKWSECMLRHGYKGASSSLAVISGFDYDKPATQTEKDEATFDIACKARDQVLPIYFTAIRAEQNHLVAAYQNSLDGVKQRLTRTLHVARNILNN